MARNNLPIRDEKQKILNLISEVKEYCFNFPTLNIDFSIPSFTNNFDSISFLIDLNISLLGMKAEEKQREITKWLIRNIKPLERDIRFNMRSLLKSCYACKINPRIAPWLFEINPLTQQPGNGINIELDQIDFDCMLKINPRSDVGRTIYGGASDMNQFLFDVIQQNGNPVFWVDPVTQKHIATFRFIEQSSPVGTTNSNGGVQDTNFRNNVINMKISNDYNSPDKNLIDFINDYFDSIIFFNTEKVVTQSVDLIFGVMTRKVKMDSACVEKKVEFEKMIDKLSENGVDDPNIEIDNSFFDFSADEIINIKKESENRRKGIKEYNDCIGCKGQPASINFESVLDLNNQLENTTDEAVRVTILEKGLGDLSQSSTNNIPNDIDKNEAKYTFLLELIRAINKVIIRMTLSPKSMFMFIMMYYLVNGQARFRGVRDWMSNNMCLLRDILQKVIEKLTREFLLVLVLRGLRLLIKKYIKAKIKEKSDIYKEQKLSLFPNGSVAQKALSGIDGGALANTVVDAGFDQAENAVIRNNKDKTKEI